MSNPEPTPNSNPEAVKSTSATNSEPSASNPEPKAKTSRLDIFHKGIVPTINIVLTILAIIAAWGVYGIQQQTAAQNRKDIDRLTEITKRLDDHQDQLDMALNVSKQNTELIVHQLTNIAFHQTAGDQVASVIVNDHTTDASLFNDCIQILAAHQLDGPTHSPDQQALLTNMVKIGTANTQRIALIRKFYQERSETHTKLYKDFKKEIETPGHAPITLNKWIETVRRADERLDELLKNDAAGIVATLNELLAERKKILERLDKEFKQKNAAK